MVNRQKLWTHTLPKKIYELSISSWKGTQNHYSLEEWYQKPQLHTSAHQLVGLKFKTDNIKCWQGCRRPGRLIHCCQECKMAREQ